MKVESRDFRFYRGGVKSQRIKERPKRKKEEGKNRGSKTNFKKIYTRVSSIYI